LFIYDGQSVNDPVLAVLTNCITDSVTSPTLSYAATVYNTSGCLTIRFKTDGQDEGAGFQHDTNKITIVTPNEIIPYPLKSKTEVAADIIDQLANILPN
jgi:hypothetical protein